jgi:CHRD domain
MTSLHPVLSRSLWLGLGAAALLVAGCANVPKSTSGVTALTGDKQVPPVTTAASGTTDISARPSRCPATASAGNCHTLHGMVNTSGVNGTAAHVHQAAAGQNGPPIVTLVKTGPNSWQVPQGTTLTDAQFQAYWDGLLYVNVHSDANPGGEIRAQLRQ